MWGSPFPSISFINGCYHHVWPVNASFNFPDHLFLLFTVGKYLPWLTSSTSLGGSIRAGDVIGGLSEPKQLQFSALPLGNFSSF